MFNKVKTYLLNPKSITEGELFGLMDIFTNTFSHGIVSKIVTEALEEPQEVKKWVWFDGPVDAGWIENMNTVLDDNKTLCLPDGKRIKLQNSFTMIFEVQDLAVASPATVSRCGIVFLEKHHLGYGPVFETWKKKFMKEEEEEYIEREMQKDAKPTAKDDKKVKKETHKEDVKDPKKYVFTPPAYFEKVFTVIKNTFDEKLAKIRAETREEIPSVDINLVTSCLNLFKVLYNEYKLMQGVKKEKKKFSDTEMEAFLVNLFIFSFYWSVGGNLEDSVTYKSREKFNREMRVFFGQMSQTLPKGDIYDSIFDLEKRKWEDWKTLVTPFTYDPLVPYFRILVETTDSVRFKYILKLMNRASFNVLLMGNGGVGKSSIVKDYLFNLIKSDKDKFVFTSMNFSAQTTSQNIQNLFQEKLSVRGKFLCPPSGKKMIFFFDDINMPKLDLYGAQPPNELIRQIIDQGGFYDLKKHVLKLVKDCCIVASCAPPGGGRNPVSQRLFRHFHMLWMPDLSDKSMEIIFKSILKGHLASRQTHERIRPNARVFDQG
jgi:dynein heavy chain